MKKTIKLIALLLALLLCSCVAFAACSDDDITSDESDTTESVATTDDEENQTSDSDDQTSDNGDQTPDNVDEATPEQTNPWGDGNEGVEGNWSDWYTPSGN